MTGAPLPPDFHCPYADGPGKKCDMCDCFVDTHPDSPFALHPEDFLVDGHQYLAVGVHSDTCPGCNQGGE